MNEKQAKRLRRACKAYIREKQPGLEKGPRAEEAADRICAVVRRLWPRLTHRERGQVMRTRKLTSIADAITKVCAP